MKWIMGLACLMLPASMALGQPCSVGTISVTVSPSSGGTCSIVFHSSSGKYNVTVERNSGLTQTVTVDVRGVSTDDLHFVSINTNNAVWPTWVSVGTSTNRFETIDGIYGNGTGPVVLLDVYTTGHLGVSGSANSSIEMDQVNSAVIGGSVLSPILVRTGDLSDTHIAGSVYADVTATNGSINVLEVTGEINSGLGTTDIRCKWSIKSLIAASINAAIDTKYNSGAGDLWYLRTTSGGFSGSLSTRYIQSANSPAGMNVSSSLSANITISEYLDEPISAGSLTGTLSIDKGLRTKGGQSGSITLGSNGLVGHVIINAGNATSNAWEGDVTVGGSTLSPKPYYSNLPANFGGGAVGEAPFQVHNEDCVAPDSYNQIGAQSKVRHYGKVAWTSGMPVTVEYRLAGSSDPWTDITDDFTASQGSNPREVVVTTTSVLDFDMLVDYRIKPVRSGNNMLKCVGVGNGSVPVGDYSFIILG